jgi:hypothetical protein
MKRGVIYIRPVGLSSSSIARYNVRHQTRHHPHRHAGSSRTLQTHKELLRVHRRRESHGLHLRNRRTRIPTYTSFPPYSSPPPFGKPFKRLHPPVKWRSGIAVSSFMNSSLASWLLSDFEIKVSKSARDSEIYSVSCRQDGNYFSALSTYQSNIFPLPLISC